MQITLLGGAVAPRLHLVATRLVSAREHVLQPLDHEVHEPFRRCHHRVRRTKGVCLCQDAREHVYRALQLAKPVGVQIRSVRRPRRVHDKALEPDGDECSAALRRSSKVVDTALESSQ